MCGIVGAVLREGSVLDGLLAGLRALEYRVHVSIEQSLAGDEPARYEVLRKELEEATYE